MELMKSTINKISLKKEKTYIKKAKVRSSRDAAEYTRMFFADNLELFEEFHILLLNNANTTIGWAQISQGGITGTLVDVRLVAKYALDGLATGIILAHNHPSGKMQPSHSDINLTKKVQKGLEILDIKVLDHVILGAEPGEYYSFADEGIL